MAKPRICVQCREPLGNQRYFHLPSSKAQFTNGQYARRCHGPEKTPGYRPSGPGRAPIHFRDFAGPGRSICGLQGARKEKDKPLRPEQVSWGRLTVKLAKVSCGTCLVMMIQRCKKQLHAKLPRFRTGEVKEMVRQAHGRVAIHGLRELVGA